MLTPAVLLGQGMGFIDRAANVRALQTTGGDVNMAVERLLSGA